MARRSCGETPGWRKEGRKVVVQLGVVPLRIRRRQSIACPLWQPGPEWTRARAIILMRSPVRERLRFWSNLMSVVAAMGLNTTPSLYDHSLFSLRFALVATM